MSTSKEAYSATECLADHRLKFLGAQRHRDGSWSLRFKISAAAYLPDGRRVVLPTRRFTMKSKQVGRKRGMVSLAND